MPRVLVIGSVNMDVVTRTERIPLPGETIPAKDLSYFPGGKGANQAVAAARSGAETVMVGCVGGDESGRTLLDFLEADGVDISAVNRVAAKPTGTALIVVDRNGENQIVIVSGANGCLSPVQVASVEMRPGDAVLCQLEVPLDTVEAALRAARDQGATAILNPSPFRESCTPLLSLADIIVVNRGELGSMTGEHVAADMTVDDIIGVVKTIDYVRSDRTVVVTMGADGAVLDTGDNAFVYPGRPVPATDTTAAGDCFAGALAALLAQGCSIREAVEYANVAASLSVQWAGAGPSMPYRNEVLRALAGDHELAAVPG